MSFRTNSKTVCRFRSPCVITLSEVCKTLGMALYQAIALYQGMASALPSEDPSECGLQPLGKVHDPQITRFALL